MAGNGYPHSNRRVSLDARKTAVLLLLNDGQWHHTGEICHMKIGGSSGTRRLRELRKEGHVIEMRRAEGRDGFEYRLVRSGHDGDSVQRPSATRSASRPRKRKDPHPAQTDFFPRQTNEKPVVKRDANRGGRDQVSVEDGGAGVSPTPGGTEGGGAPVLPSSVPALGDRPRGATSPVELHSGLRDRAEGRSVARDRCEDGAQEPGVGAREGGVRGNVQPEGRGSGPVGAWVSKFQDANADPHGPAGRKFRVVERLRDNLPCDPTYADAGTYPEKGPGALAMWPWRAMDPVVQEAWLHVGHHVWLEAYDFLSVVYRETRNKGHWRYPNPATYLFPWEWAQSVDPYARRVGLDRVVDRMKRLTDVVKAAFAKG